MKTSIMVKSGALVLLALALALLTSCAPRPYVVKPYAAEEGRTLLSYGGTALLSTKNGKVAWHSEPIAVVDLLARVVASQELELAELRKPAPQPVPKKKKERRHGNK